MRAGSEETRLDVLSHESSLPKVDIETLERKRKQIAESCTQTTDRSKYRGVASTATVINLPEKRSWADDCVAFELLLPTAETAILEFELTGESSNEQMNAFLNTVGGSKDPQDCIFKDVAVQLTDADDWVVFCAGLPRGYPTVSDSWFRSVRGTLFDSKRSERQNGLTAIRAAGACGITLLYCLAVALTPQSNVLLIYFIFVLLAVMSVLSVFGIYLTSVTTHRKQLMHVRTHDSNSTVSRPGFR